MQPILEHITNSLCLPVPDWGFFYSLHKGLWSASDGEHTLPGLGVRRGKTGQMPDYMALTLQGIS